jgi:hypothetical protein
VLQYDAPALLRPGTPDVAGNPAVPAKDLRASIVDGERIDTEGSHGKRARLTAAGGPATTIIRRRVTRRRPAPRLAELATTRLAVARARLHRLGIIDAEGQLVSKELLPDMLPDSDTTLEAVRVRHTLAIDQNLEQKRVVGSKRAQRQKALRFQGLPLVARAGFEPATFGL